MNKISRLFLVFVLTVTTVFALSACTKKEDNQDNKTIMTEEPGIPLETYYSKLNEYNSRWYLTGDDLWEEPKMSFYTLTKTSPLYKLTSKGHISLKRQIKPAFFRSEESLKDSMRSVKKLSNINDLSYDILFKTKNKILEPQGMMVELPWYGVNLEYSISYYKDGKNIYTKNYKSNNIPTKSNKHAEYIYNLSTFKAEHFKKHGNGLYVFHIKSISTTLYYWDFEKTYEWLKDQIFAFQIGDGDDVG